MRNFYDDSANVYQVSFTGLNGTSLADADGVMDALSADITANGAHTEIVWSEGLALGA